MAMLRQAARRRCSTRACCCAVGNDNAQPLADLSNALFDAGVMPYYLHVLDRVRGGALHG
jgi:L-lysine 2,3-aminomutase